jgi:hypothetical protein
LTLQLFGQTRCAKPIQPPGRIPTADETELRELRDNLAKLSGPSVVDFYRSAHRGCAVERKPSAKAIQSFVTAWKIVSKGLLGESGF